MIREQDLRIDVYRSGAVYAADFWDAVVRVTHLPSGMQVTKWDSSNRKARDAAVEELEERLADRYCMVHYDPDAIINLPRWLGRCPMCEAAEHQAWVEDVEERLEFALRAARSGVRTRAALRPQVDGMEALVARMMDACNAPNTVAEPVTWVRKYLMKDVQRE